MPSRRWASAVKAASGGEEPPPTVITSWGGLALSLDAYLRLLVLVVRAAKLKVPLPVTAGVTSTSTQVLSVTAPTLANTAPSSGGALFQLMADSLQDGLTACHVPPLFDGVGHVQPQHGASDRRPQPAHVECDVRPVLGTAGQGAQVVGGAVVAVCRP